MNQELMDMTLTVIKDAPTSTDGGSRALDPFDSKSYSEKGLIAPPLDLSICSKIKTFSSVAGACIDAMKTNVDMQPFRFSPVAETIDGHADAMEAERFELQFAFDNLSYDLPFPDIRALLREDIESIGTGYLEWIPMPHVAGNEVIFGSVAHLSAVYVRMTRLSETMEVTVERPFVSSKEIEWRKVTHRKRFRRFCQRINGQDVWFNQVGCPKDVHWETGEYHERGTLPNDKRATFLQCFTIANSTSPYGIPTWYACLEYILCSIKATKLNSRLFDKGFLPLLILLSGGKLTAASRMALKDVLKQSQGVDNAFSAVVMEALAHDRTPVENAIGMPDTTPKLAIKQLQKPMTEGMFLDLIKTTDKAILQAYRLSPAAVGLAEMSNYASAEIGQDQTEDQVYSPARQSFDARITREIFPHLLPEGVRYHRFETLVKNTSDLDTAVAHVKDFSDSGALTPNMILELYGNLIGKQTGKMTLADGTADPDADLPCPVFLAKKMRETQGAEDLPEPLEMEPAAKQMVQVLKAMDVAARETA